MKERPILFSAPMVRAILDGRKTQTRREIVSHKKAAPYFLVYGQDGGEKWPVYSADGELGHYIDCDGYDVQERMSCPYGQPGDRLWVRETYQRFSDDGEIMYAADPASFEAMNELRRDECLEARWRPSIHMPRWASRITLEITGVRVERLNDISEADAKAEGIAPQPNHEGRWLSGHRPSISYPSAVDAYRDLWESINGPGSWDANPWVWVIEFQAVRR